MYRKQVRRRRAILVVLVVACLMLISISISEAEDGPLHSVQRGVSSVLSPVGEGAEPCPEAGPRPDRLVRRDLEGPRRERRAQEPGRLAARQS